MDWQFSFVVILLAYAEPVYSRRCTALKSDNYIV